MIFTCPRGSSMMLLGLMSRWTTPRSVRVGEAVGHLLGDIDRFDDRDRALQHLGAELDSLRSSIAM